MRDPNRIHDICVLLEDVWKRVPDWRLGQLVCNLARHVGAYDSFFVEDETMKQAMEDWLAEVQRKDHE